MCASFSRVTWYVICYKIYLFYNFFFYRIPNEYTLLKNFKGIKICSVGILLLNIIYYRHYQFTLITKIIYVIKHFLIFVILI